MAFSMALSMALCLIASFSEAFEAFLGLEATGWETLPFLMALGEKDQQIPGQVSSDLI